MAIAALDDAICTFQESLGRGPLMDVVCTLGALIFGRVAHGQYMDALHNVDMILALKRKAIRSSCVFLLLAWRIVISCHFLT